MSDEDTQGTVDELVPDVVFELLAHSRRRRLVALLREHGDSMSLADAAETVAVDEHDSPLDEIPPEEVKEIYMALYHSHVPKLVDAGIVTYHQERDLVAPGGRLDSLGPYLDLPEDGP